MPKGLQGFQKGHPSYLTEESKRKISEAIRKIQVGRNPHPNFYKFWLGKKRSPETNRKISIANTKRGRPNCVDCGKKLVSYQAKRCSKCSAIAFSAIRVAAKKGYKHSEETRRKMSEAKKGEKCYLWKGGIDKENNRIRDSIEYRFWAEGNMARDNYTCQKCKIRGEELNVHHIQNFAQYPELRFAIDNGITLSKKAHREFHKRYGIRNNTKEQLEDFLES